VNFKATRAAVLLAWGGHLAQSAYWDTSNGGPRDGASMVSGAPWHMRTLQLDGSGNKNQDRSIQPSAIVGELPPFALAPPAATPRPPAPAPTTRPPAPPPANPAPTGRPAGGGSNPGSPNGPGGVPSVTVPPTTTLPEAAQTGQGMLPALLAGAFVTGFAALLGARRAKPDRRRTRDTGRRRQS
jgi:hypothetical protein